MEELRFLNLTYGYCDQVFEIERSSIAEPWTLSQIKGLVEDKNAVARVGVVGDTVICYYSFYDICNEGNVNNLAVREDFRGKGVGAKMLEDMLEAARDRKLSALTLEVNENNLAAIFLYNKFGFAIEGKRIKFYSGKDDALIMWKRDI